MSEQMMTRVNFQALEQVIEAAQSFDDTQEHDENDENRFALWSAIHIVETWLKRNESAR